MFPCLLIVKFGRKPYIFREVQDLKQFSFEFVRLSEKCVLNLVHF